jgi:GNAT superfamily N-acetyltransferase
MTSELRKWMRLVEGKLDKPYIEASIGRDTANIDMFYVPKNQRHKGVGTRYYQEWEANLPKTVKLIRLLAADTEGQGNSDQFWEMMGFEWQYTGENLSYEAEHTMWKGVNGHPTPPTVNTDEYEDDEE